MHKVQRAKAGLASLALVGALAIGGFGGSAFWAQTQHVTLHTPSTSHHFSPLTAAEGGPPPGHTPQLAAEGGPPPGH